MANPVNLTWVGTTSYVDGRPYGQADHGGYEFEVNGGGLFAVPVGWHTDNQYSFPVVDLPGLAQGDNVVRLRTVAANGQVSEWTPAATFRYLSIPEAPTQVAVG